MGLFSKILGKLGIGKKDETPASASAALGAKPAPAATAKPAATAAPVKPAAPVKSAAPVAKPATAAPAAPAVKPKPDAQMGAEVKAAPAAAPVAISEVDVVKKLDELSKGKALNWKMSIVDLLKLLDIDSSLEARKELATELGCPANLMGDSAKMNVWLHKEVLKQIAANGGNIPKELLD
jgi:hypothetical protein